MMFGECKKKRMTVYLPPRIFELIEELAKKCNEGKSSLVEKAVLLGLPKLLEIYKNEI